MIEIWYGDRQRFGHLGVPQRWMNILGRVDLNRGRDENFSAYELSILNALGVSRFDFQRQQLEI